MHEPLDQQGGEVVAYGMRRFPVIGLVVSFGGTVAYFAPAGEADGQLQRMMRFTLVETDPNTAFQFAI